MGVTSPTGNLQASSSQDRARVATLLSRMAQTARPWAMMVLMVLSDLISLGLSWGIGMSLRFRLLGGFDSPRYFRLWPVLFLWVLSLGILGLYRGGVVGGRVSVSPVEDLRRVTVG